MKRKNLILATLLAAITTVGISTAKAAPDLHMTSVQKAIAGVPNAELAAKAASIVTSAGKDKLDVALAAIRVIISKKPSLAPAVVGAISKASPEVSAAVAGEAASLSTEQTVEIVKAASSGAPSEAGKIAAAVAKSNPSSAGKVVQTAANLVPEASDQIAERVIVAVPASQTEVRKVVNSARVSRRSAASNTSDQGTIGSYNGTIRGTVPTGTPEAVAAGRLASGSDPDRDEYGRPR